MQHEQELGPFIGVGFLFGLAAVLVTLTTVRVLQTTGTLIARPVGLVVSAVLVLALFGGGIVVHRYELMDQAVRIAGWTYLGSIAVTVAVVVNTFSLEIMRPGFTIALYMITTAVAAGAILGFMMGLYDAHQKQNQAELAAKKTEAQTLSNRLSVLNRVLRHDIRTQAQLLQGYIERLESENLSSTSAAEQIQRTTDRLTTLSDEARQLQDLLKEEGIEPEAVDIVETVTEAEKNVQAAHPDLTIESDLPDQQMVVASPMLTQAFEHVLHNVAEHTDNTEPRAEISVQPEQSPDQWIQISIADNGPGINEIEMIHNTNDRESQLRHSSGLGLWLVKWIVEESGGDLQIETRSTEETGTVVQITLPAPE